MWWRYTKPDNPFYRLLTRPQSKHTYRFSCMSVWTALVIGFFGFAPLYCSVLQDMDNIRLSSRIVLLFVGLVLVSAPVSLGISAISFVAHDAQATNFELILLTPLREPQIVWGYWGALRRNWYQREIPIILVIPNFLMGCSLVCVIATGLLSDRALFYGAVHMLVLVVGFLGWYWACQFLGLMLGIALRRLNFAVEIGGGVLIFLTMLWSWSFFTLFNLSQNLLATLNPADPQIPSWGLGLVMVWLIAPVAIGLMASPLAYYFVRNPVST
jgi:hypothetical protein